MKIASFSASPRSLDHAGRHDTIAASYRSMNVYTTKCWRPTVEMSTVPENTTRSGSNRVSCPIIGTREGASSIISNHSGGITSLNPERCDRATAATGSLHYQPNRRSLDREVTASAGLPLRPSVG
jgi:hypothetical protein